MFRIAVDPLAANLIHHSKMKKCPPFCYTHPLSILLERTIEGGGRGAVRQFGQSADV